MPGFSCQVNYGPVILTALNIVQLQCSNLATAQPTGQKEREDRLVPFSFQCFGIGQFPQRAGLFGEKPIPETNAEFLRTFHAPDSSRLLWA
jgi:hypothetical protein